MTTHFDSITQYDNSFDVLFPETDVAKKGYACTWFALLTACKFLKGVLPTEASHDKTVRQSVLISKELGTSGGYTFATLLENYTSIKSSNINATSVSLILEGVIGYPHMFPSIDDPVKNTKYATIILKNEKYIVVMYDGTTYFVRDCHETTQYNFTTPDALIVHLETAYQFVQEINITGITYEEYSSIEFIVLSDDFDTLLTGLAGITFDVPFDDPLEDPNPKINMVDANYMEILEAHCNKDTTSPFHPPDTLCETTDYVDFGEESDDSET
jgi:hypothetical protein